MTYRKPFTADQRRKAVREYNSFVSNVRLLRETFPPRTIGERAAFNGYRQRVWAIKTDLLATDRRVRVDELNASIRKAQAAMAEFLQMRYFGE